MKTLFSSIDINQDHDDDVLKGAVRLACDELIKVDRFNSATISTVLDLLALAILKKFTDGERSCDLIAEYAVAKVRANFRPKLH
ncbi:MAG: hypothetical protein JSR89_17965 [Proteobacteria bacterium]|nr:hypothetical protein [Pseudomonadota bacterium]